MNFTVISNAERSSQTVSSRDKMPTTRHMTINYHYLQVFKYVFKRFE